MKLLEHFDNFLQDTVNINKTRIDRLERHVDAIDTFVNDNYAARIIRCSPQGSWAHKTIIKPVTNNNEFDADQVIFVHPVAGWSANDYVDSLYDIFAASDRYKAKAKRNPRCVTLDYAGDFHLDVVPCVYGTAGNVNGYWVCNRTKNEFEQTAPDAYTAWLEGRNKITSNNRLRKVIRLMKYLRDSKDTFSVKSVLLTTLLGRQVCDIDSLVTSAFTDVPTALQSLTQRMDDWLQANATMPSVSNPVLPSETFTRHWDQAKYDDFRGCVHRYREWIDAAYSARDRDDSIRKWRLVFGDEFAKGEALKKATALSGGGLVREAMTKGFAVVASTYRLLTLPHVQLPPWRKASQQLSIAVLAIECTPARNRLRQLMSGDRIAKGNPIRFEAQICGGLPKAFDVLWQVTNAGDDAAGRQQLRGDFYPSEDGVVRWESTAYIGIHWVKAFIVNGRTKQRWGESEPFFVTVTE